ncbi:hypothetical protein B0H14DRAFT_3453195 [Mycena olivaceomarginata]|nr:hypothetical protein B0H14DRAFT_3453195 [Mycena olivaceomarginata]
MYNVVGNLNVRDFITALERITDTTASSGMTWLPKDPAVDGDVSNYLVKSELPTVSFTATATNGSPPLTMAQYKRLHDGDTAADQNASDTEDSPEEDVDTVFLEDITVYKAYL